MKQLLHLEGTITNLWFGKLVKMSHLNLSQDLVSIVQLSKRLIGVLFIVDFLRQVVAQQISTLDFGTLRPYSQSAQSIQALKFVIWFFQRLTMSWSALTDIR